MSHLERNPIISQMPPMLERQHLKVLHVFTAESLGHTERRIDLVLTDVMLKGKRNGRDGETASHELPLQQAEIAGAGDDWR